MNNNNENADGETDMEEVARAYMNLKSRKEPGDQGTDARLMAILPQVSSQTG